MKKLTDLNTNEIEMLWNRNSKLREMVFEDRYNIAQNWVDEYINCLGSECMNYQITECERHSFIEILDIDDFLDGLITLNDYFDFFNNDVLGGLLDKAIKLNELKWEIHDIVNVEVINSLNENIEQLCQKPIKYIIERCCNEYSICHDDDELKYHLVNFMLEWMDENGYYIDPTNYILYQTITKCFK